MMMNETSSKKPDDFAGRNTVGREEKSKSRKSGFVAVSRVSAGNSLV